MTQQQQLIEKFAEVSLNIQEKSALSETRLNESLEVLHMHLYCVLVIHYELYTTHYTQAICGHTKQLEQLQEAAEETKRSTDTCESQLKKVEFKVTSCVEGMANLDHLAKVADVRKLEKVVAEKVAAIQAEVPSLTEDLSVSSSLVNQPKAKLIDIESNVTLQERSTCKVSIPLSCGDVINSPALRGC